MGRFDARHVAEHRRQILRVATPEDRDERAAPRHKRADGVGGELLPSLAPMRAWSARCDGEASVKQHDALVRPCGEVAGEEPLARICLELARDV